MDGINFKIEGNGKNFICPLDSPIQIKTICLNSGSGVINYIYLYHDNNVVCELNMYVDNIFYEKDTKQFVTEDIIKLLNEYLYNKVEIVKEKDSVVLCDGYIDYFIYK